jgi:hypothetical protein
LSPMKMAESYCALLRASWRQSRRNLSMFGCEETMAGCVTSVGPSCLESRSSGGIDEVYRTSGLPDCYDCCDSASLMVRIPVCAPQLASLAVQQCVFSLGNQSLADPWRSQHQRKLRWENAVAKGAEGGTRWRRWRRGASSGARAWRRRALARHAFSGSNRLGGS